MTPLKLVCPVPTQDRMVKGEVGRMETELKGMPDDLRLARLQATVSAGILLLARDYGAQATDTAIQAALDRASKGQGH